MAKPVSPKRHDLQKIQRRYIFESELSQPIADVALNLLKLRMGG